MSIKQLRRLHAKRQKKHSGGFLSCLLFGLLAGAVGTGAVYLLHLAYSRVGLGVPQYLAESLLGTEYIYTLLFQLLMLLRLLAKPKAIAFFELAGNKAERREFSELWGSRIASVKIRYLVFPMLLSYLVGALMVAVYGIIMGFPGILNYTLALIMMGCAAVSVSLCAALMLSALVREEMLEALYLIFGTAASQAILYFTGFYRLRDGAELIRYLASAGSLVEVSTLSLSAAAVLLSSVVTLLVVHSRQKTNRFMTRQEDAAAKELALAAEEQLPEIPEDAAESYEPVQPVSEKAAAAAEEPVPQESPAEPIAEPTEIPVPAEHEPLEEVLKEPISQASVQETPAEPEPITITPALPDTIDTPTPEAPEQETPPPPADPPEPPPEPEPEQKEQTMNEQVTPVNQVNNAQPGNPAVGAAPGAQPAQRPVRRPASNAAAIQNAAAAARRQLMQEGAVQPAQRPVAQRPAAQPAPQQRPVAAASAAPAAPAAPVVRRPSAAPAPTQTSAQRPAAPKAAAPAAAKRPVAASQVDTTQIDFFRTPASDGTTRSSINANNTPAGPKAAAGGSYAPQTTARPVPVSGMTGTSQAPKAAVPVGQRPQYEAGAATRATAQLPRVQQAPVAPVTTVSSEGMQPASPQETFQFVKNPHYEENSILNMIKEEEAAPAEVAAAEEIPAPVKEAPAAAAPANHNSAAPAPQEPLRRKGLSPWLFFIPLMLVVLTLFAAFAIAAVNSFLAAGASPIASAIFSVIFTKAQVDFLWVMAESSYGLLYIAAMAIVLLLIFIVLLLLGIHLTRKESTDEWYDDEDEDDEYDD